MLLAVQTQWQPCTTAHCCLLNNHMHFVGCTTSHASDYFICLVVTNDQPAQPAIFVLQSGYRMHDRILRAAKVIVYQE